MNWRHRIIISAVLSGFSVVAPVAALSNDAVPNVDAVQTLIQSGQYVQAYEAALNLQSADALALGAESLARQVMLGEVKELKKTSKAARDLAEQALILDPNHQNARLQYVITDGFVARLTGNVSAWMKKLPQKSFEQIEIYRATFPNDARGDALLGAWHLAIVRKAGNGNAEKWFDASTVRGQALYETALISRPNDPVIALNYAFGLIALDTDDFSDWEKVRSLLMRVQTMPATDDLNRKVIEKATGALSHFDDKDTLRDYVEAFLDGEPIG